MMRIGTAAIWLAFAGALSLPAAGARRKPRRPEMRMAQASRRQTIQPSAPQRPDGRRRRLPIYPRYQPEPDDVYPRYYPGPNAVRDCTATYVQEYRPSGTVIVPRMTASGAAARVLTPASPRRTVQCRRYAPVENVVMSEAGTVSRDSHSFLRRRYSPHIHVAHFSFAICVAARRLIDQPLGAGVNPMTPRENNYERDETSGTCCSRRIADPGRSEPSAPRRCRWPIPAPPRRSRTVRSRRRPR